jgi:hypothetical protein
MEHHHKLFQYINSLYLNHIKNVCLQNLPTHYGEILQNPLFWLLKYTARYCYL